MFFTPATIFAAEMGIISQKKISRYRINIEGQGIIRKNVRVLLVAASDVGDRSHNLLGGLYHVEGPRPIFRANEGKSEKSHENVTAPHHTQGELPTFVLTSKDFKMPC